MQISGLHSYDPKEIASVLKETGLKTAGIHVKMDVMVNHFEEALEQAHLFHTKDIVCPVLPFEYRSVEGFQKVKKTLNEVADNAACKGLRLSYHNHAIRV